MTNTELIDALAENHTLEKSELVQLLQINTDTERDYLFSRSRETAQMYYGKKVYMRGLIEFTNYCKNDCYYCGIRNGNTALERYRLTDDQIFECCNTGYKLGFRTFVLQGGEDEFFTCEHICRLVTGIKSFHPDCAVTLSLGEKTKDEYQAYFDAGADRYLLREETVDATYFRRLKPPPLTAAKRKQCLYDLKEIGYQTGCGFMVGSPFQTLENIADDLLFACSLKAEMIGVGPFIPHHETPFRDKPAGSVPLTLIVIALARLLVPTALIPATTALGTADPLGREKGMLSGANVVMPNLSPAEVRRLYLLYDNKICTGDETAQCCNCMGLRMHGIGYQVVVDRGDCAAVSVR